MIRGYTLQDAKLVDTTQPPYIWQDLIDPTTDELLQVQQAYNLKLEDSELAVQFFKTEDGHIHLKNNFLTPDGAKSVSFILVDGTLISFRQSELDTFNAVVNITKTTPHLLSDEKDLLFCLYETDIELTADVLAGIHVKLERVSEYVMTPNFSDEQATEALNVIAHEEDVNGKIRQNLLDTHRLISFMVKGKFLNTDQTEHANQLHIDIESLESHTEFIFAKINFLMDAIRGFISINQNKIIKIFSVASVVFLPPTLVASIYGMNFKHMPELEWALGYPLSLAIMVATALTPFYIFWRKGWLR
jgi:magnesium transporter